jgi:transducin (beta)-like 1
MSLTSDDVNTLVYRYLLESGFTHTAFAFNHEAHLAKAPISMEHIPPGSLVTYIQKGLQFDEIEAHINEV